MLTEIRLPQWGMEMRDGTVVAWKRSVGDTVEEGDILAEVETAKVVGEVIAPCSGVLAQILVPEGETVPISTVLAMIDEPD